MRLRNKKTGDIGDYLCVIQGDDIYLCAIQDDDIKLWSATNSYESYHYKCVSEFANEWEDYKPVEPLIQDEKVRKAVRAWADVNGDTKLYYNRPTIEICVNNKAGYVIRSIKFKAEFREAIDIESGYYNITELCGEAE